MRFCSTLTVPWQGLAERLCSFEPGIKVSSVPEPDGAVIAIKQTLNSA